MGSALARRLPDPLRLHLAKPGWREAIAGIDFRGATVIHLAARVHDPRARAPRTSTATTSRRPPSLAEAAAEGGAARFVFAGTVKVHGEETRRGALPSRFAARAGGRLRALEVARRGAAATRSPRAPACRWWWCACRSSTAPGWAATSRSLLRLADSGAWLPLAAIRNRRSLVHVADLVEALLLAATHPQAPGRDYIAAHPRGRVDARARDRDPLGPRPARAALPRAAGRARARGRCGRDARPQCCASRARLEADPSSLVSRARVDAPPRPGPGARRYRRAVAGGPAMNPLADRASGSRGDRGDRTAAPKPLRREDPGQAGRAVAARGRDAADRRHRPHARRAARRVRPGHAGGAAARARRGGPRPRLPRRRRESRCRSRCACHATSRPRRWPWQSPGRQGAALDAGTVAGASIAFLAIAWMTNLYNFMDGADGLAGGMATIGFGALALAAFGAGDGAIGHACARDARPRPRASSSSTSRPPASSWATRARCRWASSPARWAGWAPRAGSGRRGFRCSCSRPSSSTPRSRSCGGSWAREPVLQAHRCALLPAPRAWRAGPTAAWRWRPGASWRRAPRAPSSRWGSPGGLQGAIIFAWALAYGALLVRIDRRHPRGQAGSGSGRRDTAVRKTTMRARASTATGSRELTAMKPFQMDSQALVALAHDAVALTLSWAFAFALLRGTARPPCPAT